MIAPSLPISAARWVVLPPGAAHRSRTRSPGCGSRSSATAIAARDCGISSPLLPLGGGEDVDRGVEDQRVAVASALEVAARVGLERVDADGVLGAARCRPAISARAVSAPKVSNHSSAIQGGWLWASAAWAGVASGRCGDEGAGLAGGAAEDGVDEAGAARARRAWRARPLSPTAACAGTRSRKVSWKTPRRRAARTGGSSLAGVAVGERARSRGRAWPRAGRCRRRAAWPARGRARRAAWRRASPCSARSAHAPCSNTRRTTAYAHARAGAMVFMGSGIDGPSSWAVRAFTRAAASDWLRSGLRKGSRFRSFRSAGKRPLSSVFPSCSNVRPNRLKPTQFVPRGLMDRVQLADTPHGRGCRTMLDTDTTYGMTPRPSALGDLRFAGTIAAGLVAGTLGLGALAAPLVGWKDWPSALGKDASCAAASSSLRRNAECPRSAHARGGRDGGGTPAPRSATPLNVFGVPGRGGAPAPAGGGLAVPRRRRRRRRTRRPTSAAPSADVRLGRARRQRRARATATGTAHVRAAPAASRPSTTATTTATALTNDYENANDLNPDEPDGRHGHGADGHLGADRVQDQGVGRATIGDTNDNGDDRRRRRLRRRRRVQRRRGAQRQRSDEGRHRRRRHPGRHGRPRRRRLPRRPARSPATPEPDGRTPVDGRPSTVTPPVETPARRRGLRAAPVETPTPPVTTPPTSDPAPPQPPRRDARRRPRSPPAPAPEETPAPEEAPPAPAPEAPSPRPRPRQAAPAPAAEAPAPAPAPAAEAPAPAPAPRRGSRPGSGRAGSGPRGSGRARSGSGRAGPGRRGPGRSGRHSRLLVTDFIGCTWALARAPRFVYRRRGARRSRPAGGAATRPSRPGPARSGRAPAPPRARRGAAPARGRPPAACPRRGPPAARPAPRAAPGVSCVGERPERERRPVADQRRVVAGQRDQRVRRRRRPRARRARTRPPRGPARSACVVLGEQPVVARLAAEVAEGAGDRGRARAGRARARRGRAARPPARRERGRGVAELAEDVGGELAQLRVLVGAELDHRVEHLAARRGRRARTRAAATRRRCRATRPGRARAPRRARGRAARGRSGS